MLPLGTCEYAVNGVGIAAAAGPDYLGLSNLAMLYSAIIGKLTEEWWSAVARGRAWPFGGSSRAWRRLMADHGGRLAWSWMAISGGQPWPFLIVA